MRIDSTLMRAKVACPVYTIVMLSALFVNAQSHPSHETDVENSQANTSLIIADIRPKLFGDLPPSELQIYRQIQFSVSDDDKIMNAYASHKGGVRRVVVTEAMGRAIKLNTDAFLMEQLYHMHGFLGNYMSYVCKQYQTNYKRDAQGLPAQRISSPYEFAHWSDKDLDEFYSDQDVNKARSIAVGGAFAFLLAHEVAHHVKGHVDHPASDLAGQRQQEAEADTWAIDLLVRKKLNPVDGIIPLLFFYYTDQNPVSNEKNSDHPADARRLLQMYQGLSARLPSFRPYLGVDYDTARKQVDLAISLVNEEIAAGQKDQNPGQGGARGPGNPSSFTTQTNSAFCSDLDVFVRAAAADFRSLRGRRDPDGEGEAFYALQGIVGFTDCEVWVYHDPSESPSATCDMISGDVGSMQSSIAACLSPGWSSTSTGGGYTYEGPGGTSVRFKQKKSGAWEIWIDSPSKD